MIDTFAGIMVFAFWIVLFAGLPGLFLLRLRQAIKDGYRGKKLLFIVLMPLSIGYFQTYRNNPEKTWIYEILMVFFSFCALLTSGFMFFIRM